MMENPANAIKDAMWKFLMDGNQIFDNDSIDDLTDSVHALIQATTQKTAGQRKNKPADFDWKHLDVLVLQIACHATALVLSGRLEELRR